MKVLIIDDSPEALAVAKARLAKERVEIICADGGPAGLEAAKNSKPDLILLDIDMPDMSGFSVCRMFKADAELCMVPVIFLSGSGSAADKVRGLDLGAVDYITKPFDAFELRARVRAALRTKHLQDMLVEFAHIDPLTGLPNRRALMERLKQEWSRMQRHGGNLALVMADVDSFKQINDTYGHSVADQLLQEVAKAIKNQCRREDLPTRYGGDEFAIVVCEQTAAGASHLAERCRQIIESISIEAGQDRVLTTASFGVGQATQASTVEELINAADEQLYQAKRLGRNRVEYEHSSAEVVESTTKS